MNITRDYSSIFSVLFSEIEVWSGVCTHRIFDTFTMNTRGWFVSCDVPMNTTHCPCAGLMFGQRRRRWPNIKPSQTNMLCLQGVHVYICVCADGLLPCVRHRGTAPPLTTVLKGLHTGLQRTGPVTAHLYHSYIMYDQADARLIITSNRLLYQRWIKLCTTLCTIWSMVNL